MAPFAPLTSAGYNTPAEPVRTLEFLWRLRGHLHNALNRTRTVFDAEDVGMLSEGDDFRSFERNAGENWNGVEQNGDRRCVGNGAIVAKIRFRIVGGLVVVRSFDERYVVAERRGAFGAGDGFGSGFGTGAGDEKFSRCCGFFACGQE